MPIFQSPEEMFAHFDSVDPVHHRQAMMDALLQPDGTVPLNAGDPFSEAYRLERLALYKAIAGRDYSPTLGERLPDHNHLDQALTPPPYAFGSSVTVGEFFLAWGGIMQVLDVRPGMSILEMGAGDGNISIPLARMGCHVSVLDIEERYLSAIARDAAMFGASVETQQALFGDAFPGRKFDRILFFESFHHEFNHSALLAKLHGMLNPGGFIVFSGEPVVEPGSEIVPYCWGPRLDGLSVWCMNKMGWMELGFQRGFFMELLMRHGFVVTRRSNPSTPIGACYIATPNTGSIRLGEVDVDVAIEDAGWYLPEGNHRWMRDRALMPLDLATGWRTVSVRGANYVPETKNVSIVCGANTSSATVPVGEEFELTVPIDAEARYIEILTTLTRPSELGAADARELGVAIQSVEYCM